MSSLGTTGPTEAKVAHVYSEVPGAQLKYVLNKGETDHVDVGTKFRAADDPGFEVRDPDTNVPLGHIPQHRWHLVVTELHEHMAICRIEGMHTLGEPHVGTAVVEVLQDIPIA